MSTIRKAAQVAWAVLFWVLLVFLAAAAVLAAINVFNTAWILLRVSLGTT
jgi:hypothetical protein